MTGIVLILLTTVVFAFTGTPVIDWFSIDGGGGTSTGGEFTLSGSIGQSDAGTAMSSDTYTLTGGFWSGGLPPPVLSKVYLPLVLR
jgi:hypothetical protein